MKNGRTIIVVISILEVMAITPVIILIVMAPILVSFLENNLGNKIIILVVLVSGLILGQSNVNYITLLGI